MGTILKDPLEGLKSSFRGELITPGDVGYDEARSLYNGMIDKRPAVIARCSDVADVVQAVNFGRKEGMLVAIRGGGHNGAGLGSCDDGLVIDLSRMKGVHVDPEARTARVGPGCTWGDIDHATHAFGLATPGGILSTTGVGGLTLGGGHGYLTRKYGLTIDNLLEVNMVLADGSYVTANEKKNEDLYWAVRGGGGNFGVVTSFLFRLHPVRTIVGGPTLWSLEDTGKVLRWYREFSLNAPEDLYGFFAFLTVPPVPMFPEELHMKKLCGVIWCYTGPADKAYSALRPVREVAEPVLYGIQEMPYPALQSVHDPLYPPGMQWYWKADFVKEINDESVAIHEKFGADLPTMHSTMHLYPIDGAAHEVRKNDTPFSYRDANWSQVIVGVNPDPESNGRMTEWTKNYWEALHPHSAGGAYVNFLMEEGQDRVKAAYRDNYDRLVRIKRKFDPDNFFRVNQNISA